MLHRESHVVEIIIFGPSWFVHSVERASPSGKLRACSKLWVLFMQGVELILSKLLGVRRVQHLSSRLHALVHGILPLGRVRHLRESRSLAALGYLICDGG